MLVGPDIYTWTETSRRSVVNSDSNNTTSTAPVSILEGLSSEERHNIVSLLMPGGRRELS